MNTRILLFFMLFTGIFCAHGQKIKEGQLSPDFEVKMFDGTTVNSKDLEGKVIFLAFVRTVLPSNASIACSRSVGLLNSFKNDLISRFKEHEFKDDIVMIPIIMHYQSRQEITGFRSKYKFNFPMAIDENKKVSSRFFTDNNPHLFVINRDGEIFEMPITREVSAEEIRRHKARTGQTLPSTIISLDPSVFKIEEALAAPSKSSVNFQSLSFSAALEKAKKENKWLFATAYISWYTSSQHMLKNVFTRKKVGEYLNTDFVCVKYDLEEDEGEELKKRFDLPAPYPICIILRPNGTVIYQRADSTNAEAFISDMKKGMRENLSLTHLKEAYDQGNMSRESLLNYVMVLRSENREEEGKAIQQQLEGKLSPKERATLAFWPLVEGRAYGSDEFRYVVKHVSDFRQGTGRKTVDAYLYSGYDQILREHLTRFAENPEGDFSEAQKMLKSVLQEVNSLSIGSPTLPARAQLAEAYASGNMRQVVSVIEKIISPWKDDQQIVLTALKFLDAKGTRREASLIKTLRNLIINNAPAQEKEEITTWVDKVINKP